MDAVGAEHHIGLDLAPTGKPRHRRIAARLGTEALMVNVDVRLGREREQQPVQVGAVRGVVGRAVLLAHVAAELLANPHRAVVPLQRQPHRGLGGEAGEVVFEPEGADHLHRVGRHLQARAHLAELAGSLVDVDLVTGLAQGTGCRESADAGADHRHAQLAPACARELHRCIASEVLAAAVAGCESDPRRAPPLDGQGAAEREIGCECRAIHKLEFLIVRQADPINPHSVWILRGPPFLRGSVLKEGPAIVPVLRSTNQLFALCFWKSHL